MLKYVVNTVFRYSNRFFNNFNFFLGFKTRNSQMFGYTLPIVTCGYFSLTCLANANVFVSVPFQSRRSISKYRCFAFSVKVYLTLSFQSYLNIQLSFIPEIPSASSLETVFPTHFSITDLIFQ